jgi:long-chain-fatty-acyl-CoA reductase
LADVTLPVLVRGERRECVDDDDSYRFEYEDGTVVRLPKPSVADAVGIASSDRTPLRETSIDDITLFFDEVRRHWTDPENRWRRTALEVGSKITGYAPSIVLSDIEYMGRTLARAKQYDFLATDLGDPGLLDEWRPSRAVYSRCVPKGLITHIMVGNVPLAGLFALYRSLATKNVTVAKLPRRDPISALCFANCIYDVDREHPITKALSTLYWESNSAFEDVVIGASDTVSVWGRGETVEALKARLPYGVDLIEFGPKRSVALVLEGVSDFEDLARRIAFDIAAYDQEACFSCQEIFCRDGVDELSGALADALDRYEQVIPRRPLTVDQDAHVLRARMEAVARGWRVLAPEGTEWTVVITDGPIRLHEHPLARFVYLHPVADSSIALGFLDRDVQTVTISPWSEIWRWADAVIAAGADRITQAGQMSRFRAGLSHDGFHPMRRMVKWVTIERELAYKYRFGSASPAEYDARLFGVIDEVEPRRSEHAWEGLLAGVDDDRR